MGDDRRIQIRYEKCEDHAFAFYLQRPKVIALGVMIRNPAR